MTKTWTPTKAAEELGISVRTLYKHIQKKNLGKRIGKKTILLYAEDMKILKNRGKKGNPQIATLRAETLGKKKK
jgi:hypothetical protein